MATIPTATEDRPYIAVPSRGSAPPILVWARSREEVRDKLLAFLDGQGQTVGVLHRYTWVALRYKITLPETILK